MSKYFLHEMSIFMYLSYIFMLCFFMGITYTIVLKKKRNAKISMQFYGDVFTSLNRCCAVLWWRRQFQSQNAQFIGDANRFGMVLCSFLQRRILLSICYKNKQCKCYSTHNLLTKCEHQFVTSKHQFVTH